MNRFNLRLKPAVEFENMIEKFLSGVANSVAKNGTEHTHPLFVDKIRIIETEASKFVRFAPDGVMLHNGNVKHWEAKLSRNLEKDAYETYVKYELSGCRVIVFFGVSPQRLNGATIMDMYWPSVEVYWQSVSEIKFIQSEIVVGRFSPEWRHPIIDGWICRRAKNGFRNYTTGSGTPYREVDVASLNRLGFLTELAGH